MAPGAGAYLVDQGPYQRSQMKGFSDPNAYLFLRWPVPKVDIFRDTALRYLGYANEVGEAFR